ncbi:unnamed protein product [Acanthosepion pharaonis]|uniref:Uncharacterized protein n=1 Tax=Acanthosepion pharaonis TaxID=158019 RepID=A0A812BG67_ACAPH|nr:unnamed protein product [Sepia pharaonis]
MPDFIIYLLESFRLDNCLVSLYLARLTFFETKPKTFSPYPDQLSPFPFTLRITAWFFFVSRSTYFLRNKTKDFLSISRSARGRLFHSPCIFFENKTKDFLSRVGKAKYVETLLSRFHLYVEITAWFLLYLARLTFFETKPKTFLHIPISSRLFHSPLGSARLKPTLLSVPSIYNCLVSLYLARLTFFETKPKTFSPYPDQLSPFPFTLRVGKAKTYFCYLFHLYVEITAWFLCISLDLLSSKQNQRLSPYPDQLSPFPFTLRVGKAWLLCYLFHLYVEITAWFLCISLDLLSSKQNQRLSLHIPISSRLFHSPLGVGKAKTYFCYLFHLYVEITAWFLCISLDLLSSKQNQRLSLHIPISSRLFHSPLGVGKAKTYFLLYLFHLYVEITAWFLCISLDLLSSKQNQRLSLHIPISSRLFHSPLGVSKAKTKDFSYLFHLYVEITAWFLCISLDLLSSKQNQRLSLHIPISSRLFHSPLGVGKAKTYFAICFHLYVEITAWFLCISLDLLSSKQNQRLSLHIPISSRLFHSPLGSALFHFTLGSARLKPTLLLSLFHLYVEITAWFLCISLDLLSSKQNQRLSLHIPISSRLFHSPLGETKPRLTFFETKTKDFLSISRSARLFPFTLRVASSSSSSSSHFLLHFPLMTPSLLNVFFFFFFIFTFPPSFFIDDSFFVERLLLFLLLHISSFIFH